MPSLDKQGRFTRTDLGPITQPINVFVMQDIDVLRESRDIFKVSIGTNHSQRSLTVGQLSGSSTTATGPSIETDTGQEECYTN